MPFWFWTEHCWTALMPFSYKIVKQCLKVELWWVAQLHQICSSFWYHMKTWEIIFFQWSIQPYSDKRKQVTNHPHLRKWSFFLVSYEDMRNDLFQRSIQAYSDKRKQVTNHPNLRKWSFFLVSYEDLRNDLFQQSILPYFDKRKQVTITKIWESEVFSIALSMYYTSNLSFEQKHSSCWKT